jgi:hypothetical protein
MSDAILRRAWSITPLLSLHKWAWSPPLSCHCMSGWVLCPIEVSMGIFHLPSSHHFLAVTLKPHVKSLWAGQWWIWSSVGLLDCYFLTYSLSILHYVTRPNVWRPKGEENWLTGSTTFSRGRDVCILWCDLQLQMLWENNDIRVIHNFTLSLGLLSPPIPSFK